MNNTPDIIAQVMARRVAAGFSIHIRFNDGRPDFTGHYRSVAERDAKIAAAKRMPTVASVEIIG